ncbi:MAG: hypothetical protein KF873_06700 [Gemmataceae bacterium]|nr:hypothetical protein [Planctomycetia bacterium]MBX3398411.1 hypothetical protein [Gemmataceae bacterium]
MNVVKSLSRIGVLTIALALLAGCGSDKPAGGDPKIQGDSKFKDMKPVSRSAGGAPGGAPAAGGGGSKAAGALDKN